MPGTEWTELDWIELQQLRFEAIVGILAFEQARAQPLELEICLGVDLDGAGATGDLAQSVDYAAVAHQTRFIAQQGRWRLIESLGTAICRLLLAPPSALEARTAIQGVEVHIAKPTILEGLAVPSVRLRRQRGWCTLRTHEEPGARIETLEATPLSGAYRVHILPGATWQPSIGVALMVVAGKVHSNGTICTAGTELARLHGPLENQGSEEVTLLAVGTPPA